MLELVAMTTLELEATTMQGLAPALAQEDTQAMHQPQATTMQEVLDTTMLEPQVDFDCCDKLCLPRGILGGKSDLSTPSISILFNLVS